MRLSSSSSSSSLLYIKSLLLSYNNSNGVDYYQQSLPTILVINIAFQCKCIICGYQNMVRLNYLASIYYTTSITQNAEALQCVTVCVVRAQLPSLLFITLFVTVCASICSFCCLPLFFIFFQPMCLRVKLNLNAISQRRSKAQQD